jgi:hypothetical protein
VLVPGVPGQRQGVSARRSKRKRGEIDAYPWLSISHDATFRERPESRPRRPKPRRRVIEGASRPTSSQIIQARFLLSGLTAGKLWVIIVRPSRSVGDVG